MRMYDLIEKKKRGQSLERAEINAIVEGFTKGSIPDYQMAALLMAICFRSMTLAEMRDLTLAMAASGDEVDLSALGATTVDKHSTGGVGDKTTLIACPIVAAAGGYVAKMSGRSLGHTGGTLDKLEAIPGFKTTLSRADFFAVVKKTGISLIGQSEKLAPADKKIYALRDLTATVDSIPLIAASIMSKKLAAGSAAILLDVKMGSGAFMKTEQEALALAHAMVAIGEGAGRKSAAIITDMDKPLGFAVGNALEVAEAVEALQAKGPSDLVEVSLALAADMLRLIGRGDFATCQKLAQKALADGSAFAAFCAMVEAQEGDTAYLSDPLRLLQAAYKYEILAENEGFIFSMDTEMIGKTAFLLGAGRKTKDSAIDHGAGIRLVKKTGDSVKSGDLLAVFHTNDKAAIEPAAALYRRALAIKEERPVKRPLIFARVTKESFQEDAPPVLDVKESLSAALIGEAAVAMAQREQRGAVSRG